MCTDTRIESISDFVSLVCSLNSSTNMSTPIRIHEFYIYAPIRSMRQQVQHGRYILFPNHIGYDVHEEGAFEWTMDPIPKDHPDITARIIIPKELKKQLLSDLAILGITTDFLFCDSLDTVCQGIVDSFKRRY